MIEYGRGTYKDHRNKGSSVVRQPPDDPTVTPDKIFLKKTGQFYHDRMVTPSLDESRNWMTPPFRNDTTTKREPAGQDG